MKIDQYYYIALAIMDRVEEMRLEKNIPKVKFGKELGFTTPYYHVLYNRCGTLRINTLIKVAKVLDVSVEYILSGKNYDVYKPFKIDYTILLTTIRKGMPLKLRVIKSMLKHNPNKHIMIKTLFEFEDFLKTPAIKLIGG